MFEINEYKSLFFNIYNIIYILVCNDGYYGLYCNNFCFFGIFGFECVGCCYLECGNKDCDYVWGCLIDIEDINIRVEKGIVLK